MYEDEVPKEWFCPIGQELLKNPVIASDGFTYERKEIQDWFKRSDMSPITGIRLKNRDLIPNIALKNTIEQYFEKHDKK